MKALLKVFDLVNPSCLFVLRRSELSLLQATVDRRSRVKLCTITSCQNLGFRVFFYDNYYYTVAFFFNFSEDKDNSVDCNRDFNTFGNSEDIDKNIIINTCKLDETYE